MLRRRGGRRRELSFAGRAPGVRAQRRRYRRLTKRNRSRLDVALGPFGVVTVTSTLAAASAGATAVIDVGEFTLNEVAPTLPKLTAVAPVKWLPVILIVVPPPAGPLRGESARTLGAGSPLVTPKAMIAPSRLPT
jgi:hypothetical protein